MMILKKYAWRIYYLIQSVFRLRILPDNLYAKFFFKKYMGYWIDLKNPKTLNEKIQYIKLNERKTIYTMLADKIKSKEFVKDILGKNIIIENQKIYNREYEIDFDNLKYPCVIKTNHGSGDFYLAMKRPKKEYEEKIKFNFYKAINRNLYLEKKEWQYKNIKPKILVESMLLDSKGLIPPDYKIHFFNKKAVFIYVTIGRENNTYRGVYDLNWNPLNFSWTHLDKNNNPKYKFDNNLPRPKNLDNIIETAQLIAAKIDSSYVRIDLFNIDQEKIKFGEITFHHMSGFAPITPFHWDLKLGSKLNV
jgi:hypothetical protein